MEAKLSKIPSPPTALPKQYHALIMAGQRPGENALVSDTGAPHRSFVEIQGEPMIERVIRTLEATDRIDRILISLDQPTMIDLYPRLRERLDRGTIELFRNEPSITSTVRLALTQIPSLFPLLVTTSDHALLTPEMVDLFLDRVDESSADVSLAFVEKKLLKAKFPESVRTYLPFRGEQFSGANLFAFQSVRGTSIPDFWKRVEKFRKKPFKMALAFGPAMAAQFAFRRLRLEKAFNKVSAILGVSIQAVKMPFAEAAIDVDRLSDLQLVLKILASSSQPSLS